MRDEYGITLFVCCVLLILAGTPVAAQPDFDAFRCGLAGTWDNVDQAEADRRAGHSGTARHPRRAMIYVPIDNPAIAGQLFAIKNYTEEGTDGPISRVSLHRFRPDGDRVVHEFMFLRDKERWGDLSKDLSALTGLTEQDVRINTDCAMLWHWAGDHFAGSTVEGRCVTSSFTPEPIRVEGHGELWPDRLVRHDRNYDLDGNALPIPGGDSPEVFLKLDSGSESDTCSTVD